jgi:hypothetical protein
MAEETLSKQERDKRQAVATNLELFVAMKVLTLLGIVNRIKESRAHGLNRLVTLNMGVGGDRNLRDLLKFRPDEKVDVTSAVYHFLLQDDRVKYIEEQLLPRISDEDLTKMLEGWMSEEVELGHRLTFEQITNSFDVKELWASVRHGLTIVGLLTIYESYNVPLIVPDDGHHTDGRSAEGDAPEAEVVEAEVVEEIVVTAEEDAFAKKATEGAAIAPTAPPADSGDPYDGKEDITSP